MDVPCDVVKDIALVEYYASFFRGIESALVNPDLGAMLLDPAKEELSIVFLVVAEGGLFLWIEDVTLLWQVRAQSLAVCVKVDDEEDGIFPITVSVTADSRDIAKHPSSDEGTPILATPLVFVTAGILKGEFDCTCALDDLVNVITLAEIKLIFLFRTFSILGR